MRPLLALLLLLLYVGPVRAQVDISIARPSAAPPAAEVTISVTIDDPTGAFEMGGFDLLFTYDAALTFQSATIGGLLEGCGWEYFNYQPGAGQVVRLVAIADINNGANHPNCYAGGSGSLAEINLLTPYDSSYTGSFLPIRWVWFDCGDNTVSSIMGDSLLISSEVYDFDGAVELLITEDSSLFPTIHGAPAVCVYAEQSTTIRFVNFHNGGLIVSSSDDTPPVVQCSGDLIVDNDAGQCQAVVTFDVTATDNLPGVTVECSPASGSSFDLGVTVVSCIATDLAGNVDSCSFLVTVRDVEAPTALCPENMTVPTAYGQCGAIVTFSPSVSDNCSGATITSSPASGSFFPEGTSTVGFLARDSSGNVDVCFFDIMVVDAEPPTIDCPADITVFNEPGECSQTVEFNVPVYDNCEASVICSPVSGSSFPVGVTTVTAIAVDRSQNTETCVFDVVVIDTQPPILQIPGDTVVSNDVGECDAVVSFTASASENCGEAEITFDPPAGSTFESGVTEVRVVAIDASGLSDTGYFNVMVVDTESPVLVCSTDITIYNDSGSYGAVVDFQLFASDNCPSFDTVSDPPSGTLFESGTTIVTAVAIDASGNADTCNFNVTVLLNDPDNDNLPNWDDNCPDVSNLNQHDVDSDGVGDACDNCPSIANVAQDDVDIDAVGDACDNCLNAANVDQMNTDGDSVGDACDICPNDPANDIDSDTVCGDADNCPQTSNANQADTDNDGVGDACCCLHRGDIDHRGGPSPIDISDLVWLVDFMFASGPVPGCPMESDVNGSGGSDVDITDLVYFVDFIFSGGPPPPACGQWNK